MPPPRRISPLEALRLLTRRGSDPVPSAELPVPGAPRGFLAEDVVLETAPVPARHRVAVWNGFALPPGLEAGEECEVLGTAAAGGGIITIGPDAWTLEPGGAAAPKGSGHRPGVFRVESGAPIPEGFDRVLKVREAVYVGENRVRLESVPAAGEGIFAGAGSRDGRGRIPRGTPLGERLRVFLEAAGVAAVHLARPPTVALAIVGSELIGRRRRAGSAPDVLEGRRDLTGPWLEQAVRALGADPLPLGVLPDEPDRVRDAILHAKGRADVLLFSGGIGDGLTDRTVEAIQRFEAHIVFHGVSLEGASGLFLANALGVELIGIGGKPLEAACGFDLFVRPALLARLGAARASWDWALGTWPLAAPARPTPGTTGGWRALPAALGFRAGGDPEVGCLAGWDPFLPHAPGQDGWALIDPGAPARAYYAPLAAPEPFLKLVP